jgi:hypothetical protein
MPSRELALPEEPTYGLAEGPYWEIRAHLAKEERRGDVMVGWDAIRRLPGGRAAVPYVRLRSCAAARRRAYVRLGGGAVLAASAATGLFLAAWEARVALLLIAAGLTVTTGSVYVILRALGGRVS